MEELLGLAATCFLAATLIPLPSEGALLVYLHFHPERSALAVAVATVANTAGGMTSYAIGRFIPQKQFNSRAAGWLRVHWFGALLFMAAGRFARYVAVALIS